MKHFAFVLFTTTFALVAMSTSGQNQIPLTINEVKVVINDREVKGFDNEVMVGRRWSPTIMLASGDNVIIDARYKVRRFKSRISAHKSTGIQMRIRYRCYLNGKMQKVKLTRNFFINSDRTFDEKQRFVYARGLMNTRIDVQYKGKLPV